MSAPTALFREDEIVLAEGGAFTIDIGGVDHADQARFVIDIYDLRHPVHPDGHVGWWQFALAGGEQVLRGRIRFEAGKAIAEIDDATPMAQWVNEAPVASDVLQVSAVLRDRVSNAILGIHRVPGPATRSAAEVFRAGATDDGERLPLAVANYIPPRDETVRIVAPNVFTRDAVGNLCFDVRRLLRQNGIAAELYAAQYDLALNRVIKPAARLARDLRPSDRILYFFSTADPALPDIAAMTCRAKVAYFHGITRPEAVRVFDPELAAACAAGRDQARLLAGFDRLAANSAATAQSLIELFGPGAKWTAADIRVIAPRLLPTHAPTAAARPSGDGVRLLCVGRVQAHKKIERVLELFSEVRKLEPAATLVVVGAPGSKAYTDYLAWVERKQLRLPAGSVTWRGSVSENELVAEYERASAYVSLSEDEGFGLPLLEAMLHGLPVFASDIPATREVLGTAGVRFGDDDLAYPARRMVALLGSAPAREALVAAAIARGRALAGGMDGSRFFSLLYD